MTFVLDLYKGHPQYFIPNGGSTIIPLNGAWTDSQGVATGTVFQVQDDSFDLGSLLPSVRAIQSNFAYGSKSDSYVREDKTIKFDIYIDAPDVKALKRAVTTLQSTLLEGTQFETGAYKKSGVGRTIGYPLFLKYQPDSSVNARYFQIKNGYADTAHFNDEVKLTQLSAFIPVTLICSYASYENAVWLNNVLPNGTFSKGGAYWQGDINYYAPLGEPKGFNIQISTNQTTAYWNSGPGILYGIDEYWATAPTSSKVFSHLKFKSNNGTTRPSDDFNRFGVPAAGLANSTTGEYWATTVSSDTFSNGYNKDDWAVGTFAVFSGTLQAGCTTDNNGDLTTIDGVLTKTGQTLVAQTDMFGTLNSTTNNSVPSLIFRFLDKSNYLHARCYNGNVELVKVDAGTETVIATAVQAMADNTLYTLAATLGDKQIIIAINSVNKITYNLANSEIKYSTYSRAGFKLKKTGAPAFAARWDNFAMVSTYQSLYSYEFFLSNNTDFDFIGSQFMLDFEYRDTNGVAGMTTVELEGYNSSTNTWGSIFFTSNGTTQTSSSFSLGGVSTWTRFNTALAYDKTSTSNCTKYRVRISFDRTKAANVSAEIRKMALWSVPYVIKDLFSFPPSEYQVQSYNQRDSAFFVGLQGTLETNARLIITDTIRPDTPLTAVNYQEVRVGLRKHTASPLPVHWPINKIKASASTVSIGVGVNYSPYVMVARFRLGSDTAYSGINTYADGRSRSYRVIASLSTNDVCGVGLVNTDGPTYYSFADPAQLQIVPNSYLAQVPNTSSVLTFVDLGTVEILPDSSRVFVSNNYFNYGIQVDMNFVRLSTSGSGTITVVVDSLWFLPADDVFYVDTRRQPYSTASKNVWTSQIGNSALHPESYCNYLNLNSLISEDLSIYLTGYDEGQSSVFSTLNSASSYKPVRIYPSTEYSPEPMSVTSVIRRVGSNGAPLATINADDLVQHILMYCPAYEF